jgi:prepilin-type N-terminal cleavage/methylation domain-containing protein
MNIKKTEKGFSLLELLLVVAVGAILILAGLAIYRNITNNTQINEGTRLLNVLKQETQRLYQGESSYGTVDINDILINADAVPARYVTGADEINSPFDTDVTVTGADNDFTITFAAVPQAACIKLGVEYTNDDPDFESLTINGAATEPTVTAVSGACDGDVDMVWTFE